MLGLNTAALWAPNKPTLAQDITPVHRAEQLVCPRLGTAPPDAALDKPLMTSGNVHVVR